MCKEQPMTDNPPIMLFVVESDETNPQHDVCVEFQHEVGLSKPYHVAMVPLIHKEDVVDCIDDVVKAMPIGKFDFIILAVEGYARSLADDKNRDDFVRDFQRGDLEKDFSENPFSDVREGIVVTAMDWNAENLFSAVSTYTYDDFGVPQFSDVEANISAIDESSDNGRIPDTLMAICRYMNLAIGISKFHDLLTKKRDEMGE